jgi:hypothetical protein
MEMKKTFLTDFADFFCNYNCFLMIIQVKTDDGEIVILNVCRSLVHNNQSHCPYQAAACLQHPGIREVLPLVDGVGMGCTNQGAALCKCC